LSEVRAVQASLGQGIPRGSAFGVFGIARHASALVGMSAE
jgi:hypothetical protein